MTGRDYLTGSGSRSVPLSHTHTHRHPPSTAFHSPAHPVAVRGVSQEHPLFARLWLPASILVIVILPDLLARSWRQESPRLPSTSPIPDPTDNSDQLLQGALPTPAIHSHLSFLQA